MHDEPERRARRARAVAVAQVGVVGARECVELLVVEAEHVGRHRQPLQVVGSERRRGVGAREELVRPGPGASRVRLAGRGEDVGGHREGSATAQPESGR